VIEKDNFIRQNMEAAAFATKRRPFAIGLCTLQAANQNDQRNQPNAAKDV